MASRKIGSVYAELSVKDKMTHGLNKAEKSLKAFGSKVAGIGAGFAVALPAAAVAGLATSMKSAIDAGGKLADMMARTGAEGQGLFVMQRAFENAGIAADSVPQALNKMQKALATGNDGFEKLGLSAAKLRGMDATDSFRAISEAIAKVPDPAQRAALAMEIFGKSGGQLLAVMNDGQAFETAANQVGKLGKFLADNAPELDKLGDSLSIFGSKAVEIGAALAVELTPEMQKLADAVSEMDLIGVTKDAIGFAKALGDMATNATEFIQSIPGIKMTGDLFNGAIGYAAKFGPSQGKALPGQGYINANGTAVGDRMANYNDGIMIPKGYIEGVPDSLKPKAQITAGLRTDELGIPMLSDLLSALPYEIGQATAEAVAMEPADFQAAAYEVNEMQRRGLGMGGEYIAKEAKTQISILEQIRDVLRNAKIQDKQLVWDT